MKNLFSPLARLIASSGISNVADGMFKVIIPLIALRYTQEPLMIAGIASALTFPWLFFALPAGALIDRLDRRHVILVANGARAAVLIALALIVSVVGVSIWVFYVAAFLVGTAEVFYDTASQTIMPQIVDADQITKANSKLYGFVTIANQVGPLLGGVVAGLFAFAALGVPALFWIFALLVLVKLRGRFVAGARGISMAETAAGESDAAAMGERKLPVFRDIAEGLKFLKSEPVLRTLAIMQGAINFASAMFGAVLVVWVVGPQSRMQLSESQFGLLMSMMAVGSLVGALLASRITAKIGRSAALGIGVGLAAAWMLTPALTTSGWVFAAITVLTGVGVMLWNIVTTSLTQTVTPNLILGRVNSCYRLLAWGMDPLGALVGGLIGQWFGVRTVFGAAALMAAVAGIGLLAVTNSAISKSEQFAVSVA